MKTYTVDDPKVGEIRYTDKKRYLWLLSMAFPLIPLVGMGLMDWSGREWTLWLPVLFVYTVIPLLDLFFANDSSNPPEQVVPQLEADGYYRLLTHLTVPLHFLVLIVGAGFVASHELGWFGLVGHSPALLADGINSTSDVAYYVVVGIFVRLANKPRMMNTLTVIPVSCDAASAILVEASMAVTSYPNSINRLLS